MDISDQKFTENTLRNQVCQLSHSYRQMTEINQFNNRLTLRNPTRWLWIYNCPGNEIMR